MKFLTGMTLPFSVLGFLARGFSHASFAAGLYCQDPFPSLRPYGPFFLFFGRRGSPR